VTDHIRRELVEVVESGGDLAEWIDVLILALDGCWRTGASSDEITVALADKTVRNEGRTWPDWRTADPTKAIEHVHESSPEDEPITDGGLLVTDQVPAVEKIRPGTKVYVRALGRVLTRGQDGWLDEISQPVESWPGHTELDGEPLIDPDCRDGKYSSCVGGPCECDCHTHTYPPS
jgi:hypothetical protein